MLLFLHLNLKFIWVYKNRDKEDNRDCQEIDNVKMTDFQKIDKNLIIETQKTDKEINKAKTDRKENKANSKRINLQNKHLCKDKKIEIAIKVSKIVTEKVKPEWKNKKF